MINSDTHRICRTVISAHMSRNLDHAALQTRLADLFRQRVLPRLESQLQRHFPDTQTVRIPHLTLDLGRISVPKLDEEFVARLVAQFEEQLMEAAKSEGRATEADSKASPAGGPLAVLDFFLEYGSLPWWAPEETAGNIAGLLKRAARQFPLACRRRLQYAVRQRGQLERLMFSVSDADLREVVGILQPDLDRVLGGKPGELLELFGLAGAPKSVRCGVWTGVFGVVERLDFVDWMIVLATAVGEELGCSRDVVLERVLGELKDVDGDSAGLRGKFLAAVPAVLGTASAVSLGIEGAFMEALAPILAAEGMDLDDLAAIAPFVERLAFAHPEGDLREIAGRILKACRPFLAEKRVNLTVAGEMESREKLSMVEEMETRENLSVTEEVETREKLSMVEEMETRENL
ncbi:MAG: contractile injection system tape measure protein, partial [Bacteroidota bacterium]